MRKNMDAFVKLTGHIFEDIQKLKVQKSVWWQMYNIFVAQAPEILHMDLNVTQLIPSNDLRGLVTVLY